MACPDETTIAAFTQGCLPPDRVTEIEQHLDQCADCAALFANLGRVYGPSGPLEISSTRFGKSRGADPSRQVCSSTLEQPERPTDTSLRSRGERLHTRALALQITLWMTHAAGSLWFLSILVASALARHTAVHSSVLEPHRATEAASFCGEVITAYFLVWFPVGLVWTLVNTYGLSRRSSWSRHSTLTYAVLSLPSGLAAPLSAYLLWALTRPELQAVSRTNVVEGPPSSQAYRGSSREGARHSREAGSR